MNSEKFIEFDLYGTNFKVNVESGHVFREVPTFSSNIWKRDGQISMIPVTDGILKRVLKLKRYNHGNDR